MGHLRVFSLIISAHRLHRHKWRQGKTVVSLGSERQMTQSVPAISSMLLTLAGDLSI